MILVFGTCLLFDLFPTDSIVALVQLPIFCLEDVRRSQQLPEVPMALFVFAFETEAVLGLQYAGFAHLLGQRVVAYHLTACALAQHLGQAEFLILRFFVLLEYIH